MSCEIPRMATTEELFAALSATLKANLEAGGLSSFRENEDSATYFTPNQYAALFRTLANDEIANSINAADSQRPPVFTYLC